MRPIRTLVVMATLACATAQAQPLHSSDIYPADYPTVQAVAHMGKLIGERTGGRMFINPLGPDDLDTENYTVGEVKNGTLDMARVNLAVLHNMVPTSAVPSLPYLFKSVAHMQRVLDGPIGKELLASMEGQGIIGLCFYDMGARSYIGDKAIRRVTDMKGLRVRVQPSDLWASMVQAMGADPIGMPDARAYAALRSGLIDAAESTSPAYLQWRNHNVAGTYSLTEHSMAPGVVIFSKKVWDRLSTSDREIIRAAAQESVPYMRKAWNEREVLARRTLEAEGAQFIGDVDKKSFSDVLVPLYDQVLSDRKSHDLVARIQGSE